MCEGAVCGPSREDRAQVPKCIVDCRDSTPVSGMGDLGDQERASGIRDVATHTHDEPACKEHCIRVAGLWESLDDRSDDDEDTSNCRTSSSTQYVCNVGRKDQDGESTKAWEGA